MFNTNLSPDSWHSLHSSTACIYTLTKQFIKSLNVSDSLYLFPSKVIKCPLVSSAVITSAVTLSMCVQWGPSPCGECERHILYLSCQVEKIRSPTVCLEWLLCLLSDDVGRTYAFLLSVNELPDYKRFSYYQAALCQVVMLASGLSMYIQISYACLCLCVPMVFFALPAWPNALEAAAVILRQWGWRRRPLIAIWSQSQAG